MKSLELHWALVKLGIIRSASQESTKIFSPISSPVRGGSRHDESTSTLWHHGDHSTPFSANIIIIGRVQVVLGEAKKTTQSCFTCYATQKNQGIHKEDKQGHRDMQMCVSHSPVFIVFGIHQLQPASCDILIYHHMTWAEAVPGNIASPDGEVVCSISIRGCSSLQYPITL